MRCTVTAERGESGVWVLQCVEFPGALSETRSLSNARALMREAIGFVAEVDPETVEIDLRPEFPAGLADEVAAARTAVKEATEATLQAAQLSRAAVRDMLAAGLSGRDVSTVLEISPQRVSQLVND